MARTRFNCVKCGKGFLVTHKDIAIGNFKFCKKKCAMEWHGDKWEPGMFIKRSRPMSFDEKMKFAGEL